MLSSLKTNLKVEATNLLQYQREFQGCKNDALGDSDRVPNEILLKLKSTL